VATRRNEEEVEDQDKEPDFYKTTVDLDRNKIEKFKELLPGVSLKWFVDACLDSLLARYTSDVTKEIDKAVDHAVERTTEGGVGK
jgi:hypothetical protein